MADSDFKPFATGGGANVLSQAAYEVLSALTNGFSSGTAQSDEVNKALRQGCFGAAVLMKYIADTLGTDSLDDGDLADHVDRLTDALSAGATNPIGQPAVRGLFGEPNAAFPLARMDLEFTDALCVDATGKVIRAAASSLTCNLGTVGPAINGRDQAAAFGADTFVYVYVITKIGGPVASLASADGPAVFDGSKLPATYTNWALAGVLRLDSSGNIVPIKWSRRMATYDAARAVLSNGVSTASDTAVSVASSVPADSGRATIFVDAENSNANSRNLRVRHTAGTDFVVYEALSSTLGRRTRSTLDLPMTPDQEFFYDWVGAPTGGVDFYVTGFEMDNGG